MAKYLTRTVLKQKIQKLYIDEIIVTVPFCHEKFTLIELECKRGKLKKTIKSPANEVLDLTR